jgi:hypothetical protein
VWEGGQGRGGEEGQGERGGERNMRVRRGTGGASTSIATALGPETSPSSDLYRQLSAVPLPLVATALLQLLGEGL